MNVRSKKDVLSELSSMSDDCLGLKTKIAILSLHRERYNEYAEMIFVLIEYFQLISLIIFLALEGTKEAIFDHKSLINGIIFVCQIFHPFYSLEVQKNLDSPLIEWIFCVLLCYFILKHILFLYIIGKIVYNIKNYDFLVNIWKWIFKLQGKVLYFVVSSFWFVILRGAYNDNMEIFGIKSTGIIMISGFMIVFETADSLYLLTNYCYVLPTKNLFANKSNKIELITLIQKLLLQVFQTFLSFDSSVMAWTFSSVCLLSDRIRCFYHFGKLSYYKINALFFQGYLLMVLVSLDVSIFMKVILKSATEYELIEFISITWIFLGILTVSCSRVYLKRVIFAVVTGSKISSPELLIHKVSLIKQIRNLTRVPYQYNNNYDFFYLMNQTINSRIKEILNIDAKFTDMGTLDINSKDAVNKMFLHYIESLQMNLSKNNLIKLYLADFYAKKFRLYGKALKLVQELEKSHGQLMSLNASLLIFDIQSMIGSRYHEPESVINLSTYVKSQSSFANLKQKILKQVILKIEICQEILSECPKVMQIIDLSYRNHLYQYQIEKNVKEMFSIIPGYFIEPAAFLTHYYYIVNHSISEASKYRKMYFRKFEKYNKFFKSESLQEENAYQSQNAFVLVSAQKIDAGNILFCTKSIEKIYGRESQLMIGKSISTLPFPALQGLVAKTLAAYIQNGNHSVFNKIVHGFSGHKEGYIIETDYYINVHPFIINGNFCHSGMIRKRQTTRDLLLITDNGNIEGTTKNIRDVLGLLEFERPHSKNVLNINDLCQELSRVNKAFNIVKQNPSKNTRNEKILGKVTLKDDQVIVHQENTEDEEEISIEDAKSLSEVYMKEGRELEFKSLSTGGTHFYHCIFLNKFPPGYNKRIIALQRVDQSNKNKNKNTKNVHPSKNLVSTQNICEDSSVEGSRLWKLGDEKDIGLEGAPQVISISRFKHDQPSNSKKLTQNLLQDVLNTEIEKKLQTEGSNLLSPVSSKYRLLTTDWQRIPNPPDIVSKPLQLVEGVDEGKLEQQSHRKVEVAKESVPGSQLSRDSKQLKVSNAFKTAVAVKSSPKFFKTSCFIFYGTMIGIFIGQFLFKEAWQDNVHNLKVKKDILNNALLRNYYIVDIPAYFATAYCILNGAISMAPVGLESIYLLFAAQEELNALREINNALLSNTNSLSEEMRRSLFYKDVRVFELCEDCSNQTSIKLDNFQATNTIIELALHILSTYSNNLTKAFDKVVLLSQNSLNDLSLKNAEIAEIFLQSLNDQREEILVYTHTNIAITLVLSAFGSLLMIMRFWRHYVIEKQNVMAVVRLNSVGISGFLGKMRNFKDMIENQYNFEEIIVSNFAKSPTSPHEESSFRKVSKADFQKTPNFKGINNKYLFYTIKLAVLGGIISGLAIWSAKAVNTFIDDIYEKQSQLYLINLMRSRTALAGHTISDLLFNGPDSQVENIPALTFLSNSTKEITDLRIRLTNLFSPDTLEKGSLLEQVLYGDGCGLLEVSFTIYCQLLKANGVRTGLIQVLVNFENYITDFYEKYTRLNDTEQLTLKPEILPFNVFVSMFVIVTSGESFLIIDSLNQNYEDIVEDSTSQRNLIFNIFTASLVGLMILFWFFVLKALKEAYNNFKKVLQVFPSDLILSNFHLRMFLIQTSKGALDIIKNGVDNL